jgi:membrane protein implicated in regulation of membrane protease activity
LAARLESRLPSTTEQRLRWGAVALAGFGIGGLFAELTLRRHWANELQLVAWVAVSVVAIAFVLVVRSRSRRTVIAARALALAGVLLGALGMLIHVRENYLAAPLDYHFTDSWPTTAEPVKWLLAATDSVGPAPALVPGAISFMALALLLGTLGHPALRRVTGHQPAMAGAIVGATGGATHKPGEARVRVD